MVQLWCENGDHPLYVDQKQFLNFFPYFPRFEHKYAACSEFSSKIHALALRITSESGCKLFEQAGF